MPTLYTSTIHADEQSFESFLIDCSKSFVATGGFNGKLEMPSRDTVEQARSSFKHSLENLTDLSNYDDTDWECAFEAWCDSTEYFDHDHNLVVEARRERIEKLLEKVNNWAPPTSEHVELQKFMEEELEAELKAATTICTENLNFDEWKQKEISHAELLVTHARANLEKAVEEYDKQCFWVLNLRNSLAVTV